VYQEKFPTSDEHKPMLNQLIHIYGYSFELHFRVQDNFIRHVKDNINLSAKNLRIK